MEPHVDQLRQDAERVGRGQVQLVQHFPNVLENSLGDAPEAWDRTSVSGGAAMGPESDHPRGPNTTLEVPEHEAIIRDECSVDGPERHPAWLLQFAIAAS